MEVAIIVEVLKIVAGVVLEIGRRNGMNEEQLQAYAKQIDELFMQLPSANELPDVE
jgi:hypothetical protein